MKLLVDSVLNDVNIIGENDILFIYIAGKEIIYSNILS